MVLVMGLLLLGSKKKQTHVASSRDFWARKNEVCIYTEKKPWLKIVC